ncbi:hypothetical protein KL86DPRO_20225 [uncultured delta proteobacterium]|uniref:Uncharacterized protein n=1 Tax=uncultured delta proteobacterium TaxID=34034 RepID=A0A212JWR3_9DELT|nr:hypothetical protein KL86DPRO_20225 [uncultured delta proteobacterium]
MYDLRQKAVSDKEKWIALKHPI